jgi:hypothetical protein
MREQSIRPRHADPACSMPTSWTPVAQQVRASDTVSQGRFAGWLRRCGAAPMERPTHWYLTSATHERNGLSHATV